MKFLSSTFPVPNFSDICRSQDRYCVQTPVLLICHVWHFINTCVSQSVQLEFRPLLAITHYVLYHMCSTYICYEGPMSNFNVWNFLSKKILWQKHCEFLRLSNTWDDVGKWHCVMLNKADSSTVNILDIHIDSFAHNYCLLLPFYLAT